MATEKITVGAPARPEVNLRTSTAVPGVVARPIPLSTPGIGIADSPVNTDTERLLRSLQIGIDNFGTTAKAVNVEDRERQFKEGQLAQETNQKEFSKAVEDGTIPQTANPWFIKGYQNQDGRVAGNAYYTEMRAAYSQSEAKGSDDPKVYEKFVQDFTRGYMEKIGKDKSSDWMAGFKQVSDGAKSALTSEHASQAEQAVIAKNETNTGAEINVILNGTKDPRVAADAINALGEKMRLAGMPRASFEKVAAEMVLAKAKLGDTGMLSALDYVKTGDGKGVLSSSPRVATAKVDVENFITEKRRGDVRWAWANDDRQWTLQQREVAKKTQEREEQRWVQQQAEWGRTEKTRSLMSQITVNAMADPAAAYANNREKLAELAKLNPTAAESTSNFIDAFTSKRERVTDDVERPVVAQITKDMVDAAGDPQRQMQLLMDANRAFAEKRLNKDTMMKLMDDAQRFAAFDPGQQRKLNAPQVKEVRDAVEKLFAQDPIKGATGAVALDVLYVNQTITGRLIEMLKQDPNTSEAALAAEATKVMRTQMESLGVATKMQGRAEALGGAVPKAATRTAPSDGQPPVQAPTIDTAIQAITPADQGEFVRQVQSAMETGGMPAMLKAIADFDQRVGVPGLGRTIIERNSKPPAQPKK